MWKLKEIIALLSILTGACSTKLQVRSGEAKAKRQDDAMPGARGCGGSGTFESWRLEGCTRDENPCKLRPGSTYRESEIDFIPGENFSGGKIGWRYIYDFGGNGDKTVEGQMDNFVSYQAGQEDMFGSVPNIPNTPDQTPFRLTLKVEVYRVDTGSILVCAEADFVNS